MSLRGSLPRKFEIVLVEMRFESISGTTFGVANSNKKIKGIENEAIQILIFLSLKSDNVGRFYKYIQNCWVLEKSIPSNKVLNYFNTYCLLTLILIFEYFTDSKLLFFEILMRTKMKFQ